MESGVKRPLNIGRAIANAVAAANPLINTAPWASQHPALMIVQPHPGSSRVEMCRIHTRRLRSWRSRSGKAG
jgi:hypothetical protein